MSKTLNKRKMNDGSNDIYKQRTDCLHCRKQEKVKDQNYLDYLEMDESITKTLAT
jgi:hypothetical protein